MANSVRCLMMGIFAVCLFHAKAQPKTAHSLTTNDPEAEKYLKAVKITERCVVFADCKVIIYLESATNKTKMVIFFL